MGCGLPRGNAMKAGAIGFGAGVVVGALSAAMILGSLESHEPEVPAFNSRGTLTGSQARDLASVAEANEEVERLRAELGLERELRERLAAKLEFQADTGSDEGLGRATGEEAVATRAGGKAGAGTGQAKPPGAAWFDDGRLEAVGIDPGRIQHIRGAWEAYTMEKLYLSDAQARGEKLTKPQLARRIMQIEQRLREELGDGDYEAVLYATGERNRIVLTDVLESSPAGRSGMQAGDEVLSYDGQRIFQPAGLKLMTFAGEGGESVEVRVLRDGEMHRIFVPRGPLGVRYSAESRPPFPD
jgi:hypothetical protein